MSKVPFFFIACIGVLPIVDTLADEIELILPPTAVSPQGDLSVFSTPMDVQSGHVILAHVTEADSNTVPGYLNTVIRLGRKAGNVWQWQSTRIDTHTLFDPYHAQPSVAFDKNGHIHAAYNMHNLPWQYVASERPYDISQFVFYGQAISLRDLDALRLENKTHYPNIGHALIPGNQITYPAFFKNRSGDLFVSYRYAMRPARNWENRSKAVGIARFDADNWTWTPIGSPTPISKGDAVHTGTKSVSSAPFAYDENFVPYLVTLAFDTENTMHAIWTWWDKASNQTGAVTVLPTYKNVANSIQVTQISDANSGRIPGWPVNTTFNTAKSLAIAANGDVLALLEPQGQNRKLVRLNRTTGIWSAPIDTPNSASKILVDRNGNEWVFASGIKLFKRKPGDSWLRPISIGYNLCDPRPVYSAEENSFYIHAKTCPARDNAMVYRYQID